ncbi:MAG: hypothetical protein ACK5RF_14895 [Pirellula sp.]
MKQTATLPSMLPPGLPSAAASRTSAAGLSGLPSAAKVQMRLSSEEPPKLPVSVTNPRNEVDRFGVASETPIPPSPSVQPSEKQVAVVQKPKGPVKFNVADAGVKDFGFQGASVTPPSLSRAPELVKLKKYSVSQTVVLAHSTDVSDEASTASNRLEVLKPEVEGQNIVRQTVSESRSDLPRETIQDKQFTSGLVSLSKPPKPTNSTDRNFVGVANTANSTARESASPDAWHGVEVERDYDIEIMGTYSIDAPFEIARIEAQDPECCSVFNNGRSITVVGKNQGHTKVAIISKDQQRRVVGVKVLPTGRQQSTPKSDLEQVKEMISNLFPDANLTFSNLDSGSIEIRGTTNSEGEARKVLELVRRICLVPVEDKVKVLP